MVLESFVTATKVEKYPVIVFVVGFIITIAASLITLFAFPRQYVSILSIAFIVIPLVPLIHNLFLRVEKREELSLERSYAGFMRRHGYLIRFYIWLFLGIVVGFAFMYVSTHNIVGKDLFTYQEEVLASITTIRSSLVGKVLCESTQCVFTEIFKNNTKVLLSALLFSFVYGAGALFLITWNASLVGVLLGREIFEKLGSGILFAVYGGFLRFLTILPHGIFEVVAYFIAAVSGTLFSAMITHRKANSEAAKMFFIDGFILFLFAFVFLLIGAFIEALLV